MSHPIVTQDLEMMSEEDLDILLPTIEENE